VREEQGRGTKTGLAADSSAANIHFVVFTSDSFLSEILRGLHLLRSSNVGPIWPDKTGYAPPTPRREIFFGPMTAVAASKNMIGKDIIQT
jgi:hypothetical protein